MSTTIIPKEKYDLTYKREDSTIALGVILLIANLCLVSTSDFLEPMKAAGQSNATIIALGAIRIAGVVQSRKIAKAQNRDTQFWFAMGIFWPGIALISLYYLKKLNAVFEIDYIVTPENTARELRELATQRMAAKKWYDALTLYEYIVEKLSVGTPEDRIKIENLKENISLDIEATKEPKIQMQ
ncbi:MAG: hypothetical protein H7257_10935 [Taibaiella sp.]|nr:hypothetical protein [Taibaiella sp.]